ncbi:hypothetical protein CYMTET_38344 [Cymbomonas tetramitiformis]|uniref:Integrase catalytic domain-containing protein n=1 Tax=Cymbomonas tetramitiformis TaxID=36881 RepID=A0AAE0F5K6_9CHLO|nr:hypothetical protein CYMTET_38344 [Cymbomonas tetramitiformis]
MHLDSEELAEGALVDVLAAQYQAAYDHSEEAFQAVCQEHGTPDVCDAAESVCTFPDDGSLSFSAFHSQWDDSGEEPGYWEQQDCTEEGGWDWSQLSEEQQLEWDRLQQEATASFKAFCIGQSDPPPQQISYGRVAFRSFGVGGASALPDHPVSCDLPAEWSQACTTLSAPVRTIDLHAFYDVGQGADAAGDPPADSLTDDYVTGGPLGGTSAPHVQSHLAPPVVPLDLPPSVTGSTLQAAADGAQRHGAPQGQCGDTFGLQPISALHMHEPALEPGSRLFADLVSTGDCSFHKLELQPTQEHVPSEAQASPMDLCLIDLERDHWERVWSEDHTTPTQWHDTLPALGVAPTNRTTVSAEQVVPDRPEPADTRLACADSGVYAMAVAPPAGGHGVTSGSTVTASESLNSSAPQGAGHHSRSSPDCWPPTRHTRVGVGRGGVSFFRTAFVSTFVVTCLLACASAEVSAYGSAEDDHRWLLTAVTRGPRGGAQGTGILPGDGGIGDGGIGNGGIGGIGYDSGWCWADSWSAGSDSDTGHRDQSHYHHHHRADHQFGMPPDATTQMQFLRAVHHQSEKRKRNLCKTVLLLSLAMGILLHAIYLFFMDFQPPSAGLADQAVPQLMISQSAGSVFQLSSALSAGMISVGHTVVSAMCYLGYTWAAHGAPPLGLEFSVDPMISAHSLSRTSDGIVVDSGATANITGTEHRFLGLDTSSTVGFSTVMTGPQDRTDGTCTLHLYGRDILSGEIDEYAMPGCHYKKGARTLLSTRALLRHGFSSPDFISMTYTHLESGRTYRILDDGVDFLWDDPSSTSFTGFRSAAPRTRTGDTSDWQWSVSEYTAWATTHGSPAATEQLGTPAFDVSMFGDSLPVGQGNNHPALVHWHRLNDAFKKQWTDKYFYGNIPFHISMIDRLLTKGNQDFPLAPATTVYFWIVPYMPTHPVWHKTCTMEILKIYPKGTKQLFSYRRQDTYTSSHPLTPAGSDGGPDRVFIDGTPFDICILYRDRNTPVRISPLVEFHAVMGHGSTGSCLRLYDMPGVDLGRPRLSRQAVAAMPACSQFCAVCCFMKLRQKPAGQHDRERTRDLQPAQGWASDVTGPITPAGYNGHLYRCHFIDIHSRFLFLYTIASKSDYSTCLVHFVAGVRAMGYGVQSISIHTDCAPEMGDAQCVAFYQKHGIRHTRSSPTVHTD